MLFITIFMSYLAMASEYDWMPIHKGASYSDINVTGRVVPQDGALNIESARVQGRILSILKREGETIQEGTPIYSISSAECFSLVEEKRVALSKQLADLAQGVDLREKQLGIKLDRNQCYLVSGHAGILTKRNLESGTSFNAGDPLATIVDIDKLTIELDIPERDQSKIRPDQKVVFQFASNPGQHFTSSIETVVPTIDPLTRSSKSRLKPVHLPKNISLDALVFGALHTGHNEPILKVPSTALVFQHNQQFVVAGGEEKPRAVVVQVISEADGISSIRTNQEGQLHEGDLVATKGAIFLLKKIGEPSAN